MLRLILLSVSMGLLILVACDKQKESKPANETQKTEQTLSENIYYYTCQMEEHKHIHSDKPGDCPECVMKLVAAVEATADSADYYGCSMPEHSHVRADKPGNCPECNMKLVPMRKSKEKM